MKSSRVLPTVLALIIAALLLLPFLAAAETTKEFRKEVAARPGAVVVLENLAGRVAVEGTKGGRSRSWRPSTARARPSSRS